MYCNTFRSIGHAVVIFLLIYKFYPGDIISHIDVGIVISLKFREIVESVLSCASSEALRIPRHSKIRRKLHKAFTENSKKGNWKRWMLR